MGERRAFIGKGGGSPAGGLADFGEPAVEGEPQTLKSFLVRGPGGGGEIAKLIGIGGEIVELFGGLMRRAHCGLGGREFALGGELLEEVPNGVLALLVLVGREKRDGGREIANVAETRIAHGAKRHLGFVAAVAAAEDVVARGRGAIAEKDAA